MQPPDARSPVSPLCPSSPSPSLYLPDSPSAWLTPSASTEPREATPRATAVRSTTELAACTPHPQCCPQKLTLTSVPYIPHLLVSRAQWPTCSLGYQVPTPEIRMRCGVKEVKQPEMRTPLLLLTGLSWRAWLGSGPKQPRHLASAPGGAEQLQNPLLET